MISRWEVPFTSLGTRRTFWDDRQIFCDYNVYRKCLELGGPYGISRCESSAEAPMSRGIRGMPAKFRMWVVRAPCGIHLGKLPTVTEVLNMIAGTSWNEGGLGFRV